MLERRSESAGRSLRFELRPAAEDDLAKVVRLERASATAPHWAEREYCGMLERGEAGGLRRCLFVATNGEDLGGFAVGRAVGMRPDVEAEIESVVVRESERRQGVGAALCRAVLAWSRGEGARQVELEVRAESTGAIKLYGGLGFVATGRRLGYYTAPADDALMMRCSLPAGEMEG